MANESETCEAMPGLDMVGRGVYLRPRQPFELKVPIYPQNLNKTFFSRETGERYLFSEGFEINDSVPMPTGRALNQVVIEESWDRFEKKNTLDASAAVGMGPFTVDVNGSQTEQLRKEEESYYALRNSFIPLWSIYIPDTSALPKEILDIKIPTPFSHSNRQIFEQIFEKYGTHYIKRVWVGGKAMLAFTVAKSKGMSKEDIQSGLKASAGPSGSGSLNASKSSQKESLLNNSECTVFGKGGDEFKLASLSTLDEGKYNDWLQTIKHNPQVIEFEAAGIWTLVADQEVSKALMEAYREATVFTPVRALVNIDSKIHFTTGSKHFSYDLETHETTLPKKIDEVWPALKTIGFESFDASFMGKYLVSPSGEDLSRKLFLFNRENFARMDIDTGEVDPGYPQLIADGWPGVTFHRIDAALNTGKEGIFFFLGNRYVRFNIKNNKVDEGYPDQIAHRWLGLTFDRIDASVYWGNAKVYFFKGNQVVRFDMVTSRVDPGFPRVITSNYIQDLKFLD